MGPNTRLVIGGPQGTERTVALAEADITIGRGTTNDVVLSDAKASRVHARLAYGDSQWTLIDLGSANGTLVNGLPVVDRVPLQGHGSLYVDNDVKARLKVELTR